MNINNSITHSISFSQFVLFCETLSKDNSTEPIAKFNAFLQQIRNEAPLSKGAGLALFRLLFPEQDNARKFDMQETRLSRVLSELFESTSVCITGKSLLKWADGPSEGQPGRVGCLGEEVRKLLSRSYTNVVTKPHSIHQIDCWLDELSSHSLYTQESEGIIYGQKRPKKVILKDIFEHLSPIEAAYVTQIILKDIKPLLCPIKTVNITINLLESKSLPQLTFQDAMFAWHSSLPKIYRVNSSLKNAFASLEAGPPFDLVPIVGNQILIPTCYKGRSCKNAIDKLRGSAKIYAETKYDGERAQIHVDLRKDPGEEIRIFSKSKRDSTQDRFASHEIIRAALSLPQISQVHPLLNKRLEEESFTQEPIVQQSVILEAELVAFSERTRAIDEFWRIRGLIAETAQGVRSGWKKKDPIPNEDRFASPVKDSLESNGTDGGQRHFMLVFFDILLLDGRSLLEESYGKRRNLLHNTVKEIPGFSMIASRTPIDMKRGDPVKCLETALSLSISEFEEGLVLKAEESTYNLLTYPWIKLKRDYIPGLGDCLDMVILGAGWQKDRAIELGVGTDTFTTFYVAVICDTLLQKPKLQCLFTVSYGLSRQELESLNFEIGYQSCRSYEPGELDTLSYTLELSPGLPAPSVLFERPMLFELYGAGFDKNPRCREYVIRWPRISKVYRAQERPWTEGETLESYRKKSYAAVGRDSSNKLLDIAVAEMWGVSPQTSPTARSAVKRKLLQDKSLEQLRGDITKKAHERLISSINTASAQAHIPLGFQLATSRKDNPRPDELNHEGRQVEPSIAKRRRTDSYLDDNSRPSISDNGPTGRPKSTTVGSISLQVLLDGAFSLYYRPLYPSPRRTKGQVALKSLCAHGRILSTLDALLVGCGWSRRKTPIPRGIKRGVILVGADSRQSLIIQLERIQKQLQPPLGEAVDISVISDDCLRSCYRLRGERTKHECPIQVELLWESRLNALGR